MLSLLQAIVLGAIQGVTELFPISSLGHSVLLPGLLARLGLGSWNVDQNANYFLTFLVATHFATALVLFFMYWRDWRRIIVGIFRSLATRDIEGDADARLGWLLVVTTIPAGLAGVLFEKQVQKIFVAPMLAALFLVLNGGLLFLAERLRRRAPQIADPQLVNSQPTNHQSDSVHISDADRRIAAELSWAQSVKIGFLQVIALIPGFSRTGSTLAGSLLVGLTHEDALRFSFLLETPIIGAAALLKLPPLLASGNSATLVIAVVGALAAAIAAYFSARFLARFFRTKTLTPFAVYCVVIGVVGLMVLR